MKKIKWGIIGAGGIANKFVESLKSIEDAELTAVSSRDAGRAAGYAGKYGAKRYYGSYEELVKDPDIDIIYVATPHSAHLDCTMMCLKAGKSVLCEKPFTINASQAKLLVDTAREQKVFLMEAMWTRYLPAIVKVRELSASGAIGEVRMIKADFGFRTDIIPQARLFNPDLGGGALLDVGIYPLSFASMILGSKPLKASGTSNTGITGVDEQCAFLLTYEGGQLAVLSAAIRTHIPHDAWVLGTEGYIKIPDFWHADSVELSRNGKVEILKLPYLSNGYAHEAIEAMDCLRQGRLESPVMPLDETVELMHVLDDIRTQIGLKYPGE
jgi:dihydrodiol dehydrogenase / D-xylose 1-dehydrogenase (NADP)